MATTLTVLRLAPGGEGFARTEQGQVVFVPGALPEDQVEPEIDEVPAKTAVAEAKESPVLIKRRQQMRKAAPRAPAR